MDENPRTTKTLKIVSIGVGTAVAAPVVVGGILGAIGFGSAGVAAGASYISKLSDSVRVSSMLILAPSLSGSIAAGWQASIGRVAAGSLFAGLQSLGAVGLSAGAAAAGGGTAAAGVAVSEIARGDESKMKDAEVRIVNLD